MKEYKVVIVQEDALSSLIFGTANINEFKFSQILNRYAREGWCVVTMERDIRRLYLFWKREAYVVIMERECDEKSKNFLF